jgi:hypothetical protein
LFTVKDPEVAASYSGGIDYPSIGLAFTPLIWNERYYYIRVRRCEGTALGRVDEDSYRLGAYY